MTGSSGRSFPTVEFTLSEHVLDGLDALEAAAA